MWLWSTLFDLGKTVFRGIGCFYLGAIGIFMIGGLITVIATSAARNNPEEAAALAVGAVADMDREEARQWVRDRDRRRAQRGSVAEDWERDRRDQETEAAIRSAYDDY